MTTRTSLPISETFVSVQGEGMLTGVPSFFIRTSGCNLRCTWCDTPYASWNPDGDQRVIDSIVDEAHAAGLRHVVLTGGEPMMFDGIESLTQQLKSADFHITIETAGTIARTSDVIACDLMSVSPKLANSTPHAGDERDPNGVWRARHESRRLNHTVLQALVDGWPEHQLKFVVTSASDLQEIDAILKPLSGVSADRVMLMPEGVIVPSATQTEWITNACIERGYRYCPRLHIALFGNTRGT